jgi:hypothetical protein
LDQSQIKKKNKEIAKPSHHYKEKAYCRRTFFVYCRRTKARRCERAGDKWLLPAHHPVRRWKFIYCRRTSIASPAKGLFHRRTCHCAGSRAASTGACDVRRQKGIEVRRQ